MIYNDYVMCVHVGLFVDKMFSLSLSFRVWFSSLDL